MWASLIRIINPISGKTIDKICLEQNEAAYSVALTKFASRGEDQFVIVGTVKDLVLSPRTSAGGYLYTYQLINGGESLQLLHKTPVDDIPSVIVPFQGRILIGIGRNLRIYELGKKKLLRKCENKVSYE